MSNVNLWDDEEHPTIKSSVQPDPWASVLVAPVTSGKVTPHRYRRTLSRKNVLLIGIVTGVMLLATTAVVAFAAGTAGMVGSTPARNSTLPSSRPTIPSPPPLPTSTPIRKPISTPVPTPTVKPTPMPKPTPSPRSTVSPHQGNTMLTTPPGTIAPAPILLLLQDSFQRNDVPIGWGTATAARGQQWHVSNPDAFTVFSRTGYILPLTQQPAFYTATLGASRSEPQQEATLAYSFQGFASDGTQTNVGVILRENLQGYYKAYMDGGSFIVMKNVNGVQTQLARIPFVAHDTTLYHIRFRMQGSTLLAKAWSAGSQSEPKWMITTHDTDAALVSGKVGVRALLQQGDSVQITSFTATE